MDDDSGRPPERILLAVVLAVAVLVPVAATQLEVSPHRITPGTVVVSGLLLIGTIALPALLLSRWQSDEA
ncbi:hypothetical protein ACLI4Z_07910 [Natrialbaceae archaeon A-arb3/5]